MRERLTCPEAHYQPGASASTHPDAGPENEMCLTVPAWQAALHSLLWFVGAMV